MIKESRKSGQGKAYESFAERVNSIKDRDKKTKVLELIDKFKNDIQSDEDSIEFIEQLQFLFTLAKYSARLYENADWHIKRGGANE